MAKAPGLHHSSGYGGGRVVLQFDITDFRRRAKKLNGEEMPRAVQKALWNTANGVRDRERQHVVRRTFNKSPRMGRKKWLARGIRSKGGKLTPQNTAEVYTAGRGALVLRDHHEGTVLTGAGIKARPKVHQGSRLHVFSTSGGPMAGPWVASPSTFIKRNAKGELDLHRWATEYELSTKHFIFPLKKPGTALWAVRTARGRITRTKAQRKGGTSGTRSPKPLKARSRTSRRWNNEVSKTVFLLYLQRRAKIKERFKFFPLARKWAPKLFPHELRKSVDRMVEKKTFG